mmetsp:Transcript_13217/g.11696  ORF Transcript_13217/g.11696 Transcript_13217/m.11696 type:complete len:123 (-) Transcript_13217:25-393(-)
MSLKENNFLTNLPEFNDSPQMYKSNIKNIDRSLLVKSSSHLPELLNGKKTILRKSRNIETLLDAGTNIFYRSKSSMRRNTSLGTYRNLLNSGIQMNQVLGNSSFDNFQVEKKVRFRINTPYA